MRTAFNSDRKFEKGTFRFDFPGIARAEPLPEASSRFAPPKATAKGARGPSGREWLTEIFRNELELSFEDRAAPAQSESLREIGGQ